MGLLTFTLPMEVIGLFNDMVLRRFNLHMPGDVRAEHWLEIDEREVQVTCLHAPSDNRSLLLVGYSDGLVELRDTNTLHKMYFTHKFEEGQI